MKVGEFLMKMIFFSGTSQKEIAKMLGVSAPVLNDIVKGKRGINCKYAKCFENIFGIPAIVWMQYQIYDELNKEAK